MKFFIANQCYGKTPLNTKSKIRRPIKILVHLLLFIILYGQLSSHSISCVCLICQISIFLSLLSEWFIQCKEFEVCCFLFFKWTNVRDFLALFDEYLNNFFRKWRQIWQAISLITTSDYYIRIFRFMLM